MTSFESTRGGEKGLSFRDAFFSGWANDGGMYVPSTIPKIPDLAGRFSELRQLSYSDLAFELLSLFISADDIPSEDLRTILHDAFQLSNFPNRIDFEATDSVVNLRAFDNFSLLELWAGHTFAFKDLGMAFVGSLLEYYIGKRSSPDSSSSSSSSSSDDASASSRRVNILVATSGDTGSAALHAVKGKKGIEVFVLFPGNDRITHVQERQMTTVLADNCHVIAIDGTSDDADVVLQDLFSDPAFKRQYGLTSINSVNIARLLIQIVHFVWAWLRLASSPTDEVQFVVPSGGLGNASAGMLATYMGVPCRFLLAVNKNNTLDVFAKTGELKGHPDVHVSLAPSMDIAVPYNLERLFYLLAERDGALVGSWMRAAQASPITSLPSEIVAAFAQHFQTSTIHDEQISQQIAATYASTGYILDPHTAVAVAALASLPATSKSGTCVVATAHWCKFSSAVIQALKDVSPKPSLRLPEALSKLDSIPTRVTTFHDRSTWPSDLRQLVQAANRHNV